MNDRVVIDAKVMTVKTWGRKLKPNSRASMYLNKMKKDVENMALKNPFWSPDNKLWQTRRVEFKYLETLVLSPKKVEILQIYENLYNANLQLSFPAVRDL